MFTTTEKSTIKSIAIGRFDGLHRGHQALIAHLGSSDSALVVIATGQENLTPDPSHLPLTVPPLITYDLASIKTLSGEAFILRLKEDFPALEHIVVGYDFCFGYQRQWHAKDIAQWFNGHVTIVEQVFDGTTPIHSRHIRHLLIEGDIVRANTLLGWDYRIWGTPIKGQGLGQTQFVPTINLSINHYLFPKEGVYITSTIIADQSYPSVSFIGHRVSTDGNYAVETHLLVPFRKELEASKIGIVFHTLLRPNRYFEAFEELKVQILNDITSAKTYHSLA